MNYLGYCNNEYPDPPTLQEYVIEQLERIMAELKVPMNTGLIAHSIAEQTKNVVAAWPNVMYMGKPTRMPA